MSRRLRLPILLGFFLVVSGVGQSPAPASIPVADRPSLQALSTPEIRLYRLRLFNTHTEEREDVVYRRGETYLPEAVASLERQHRDFRRDEVRTVDPRLFDLLVELARSVGRPETEFQVISGYRSPLTNEMLRQRATDVAERSLHMQAKAIDIRLPGVPTRELRDAALRLARGGVGYYAASDFIHIDTGRVRRW